MTKHDEAIEQVVSIGEKRTHKRVKKDIRSNEAQSKNSMLGGGKIWKEKEARKTLEA